METLAFKITAITVLSLIAMWLFKKLIECFFNISILSKAQKDHNHPSRISSSDVVVNTDTKKLEGNKDKIILPF